MLTVMDEPTVKRHRAFRLPDDVYRAAQAEAERRGETLTTVVLRALRRYAHSSYDKTPCDPDEPPEACAA